MSLQISSNGFIVFGNQIPSFSSEQEPEPFPLSGRPIVAPFWAQANYDNINVRGNVEYRVTTSSFLLGRARDDIDAAYIRAGITQDSVSLSALVVVTWNDLRSAHNTNAVSQMSDRAIYTTSIPIEISWSMPITLLDTVEQPDQLALQE